MKLYKLLFYIFGLLLIFENFSCSKDKKLLSSTENKVSPNDFLSSNTYDFLIVEIQYVSGYEPTAACVDNLKTLLQQRINKNAGISVIQNTISSPGKSLYSLNDIKQIENSHRTQHTSGKTLTAYFLFFDGDYSENSGNAKVLGITYAKTSVAIFEKTIKAFSGGITQPSNANLESTVVNHEFGHLLGLVNNGTSMKASHQDIPNGSHCNDKNCLMYFNAETSDVIANIIGGVPSLDAQCIDDLRANGGK